MNKLRHQLIPVTCCQCNDIIGWAPDYGTSTDIICDHCRSAYELVMFQLFEFKYVHKIIENHRQAWLDIKENQHEKEEGFSSILYHFRYRNVITDFLLDN